MPTKVAHDYVGGRTVFEDLKKFYPELVRPFRRTPRGDEYYRKEVLDAAMAAAEANEDLLAAKNV